MAQEAGDRGRHTFARVSIPDVRLTTRAGVRPYGIHANGIWMAGVPLALIHVCGKM